MKKLIGSILGLVSSFVFVVSANAQQIGTQPNASLSNNTFGGISSWTTLVYFIINVFVYLGWAGVFIGIGFVLFSLIYKLMNSDNEEAMKTVQGYITKAILIVIAGLLLLSIGFIIQFVSGVFGITPPSSIVNPSV